MGAADDPTIRELAEVIARQAASMEAWESAELHVLEVVLRERLAALGTAAGPEAGAVLMVVAQLLAERAPEWGGDARDTLAEVAVLGLRLLDDAGA
ncbi:MAG: hypothetical protein ACLGIO_02440 [Acidimicrobiia bacterium]